MKLNEITETGFYKALRDDRPNYIYEVINNTDEEWLKESPDQKFLIDEWIFDYIDFDDRYHYGTAGNLVSVPNADDIEVVKITNKSYKIEGGCGEYLIEDKPTYKEKATTYQQTLSEIRDIANWHISDTDSYDIQNDMKDIINKIDEVLKLEK